MASGEEESDCNHRIDLQQEGDTINNGQTIIIYNCDGAELTPELLAKTLEELSTQTSLNKATLGESILLDESGRIIQQDNSENVELIKVEASTASDGMLFQNIENTTGIPVVLSDTEGFEHNVTLLPDTIVNDWDKFKCDPNLKLEVIAQDAITGETMVSKCSSDLNENLDPSHGSTAPDEPDPVLSAEVKCVTESNSSYTTSTVTASISAAIVDSNDQFVQGNDGQSDAICIKRESVKTEYHCNVCDVILETEIELQRHQKTEHNIATPFMCRYCLKSFKLELTLDIHMLSHTTNSAAPKMNLKHIHKVNKFFSCPLCDYQYQRKPQLMTHMVNCHQGEKYMFCNECNYSCLSEEKLVAHKETTSHKEEQRTLCPLCGASTKNLRQHVSTAHNESRPFMCTTCGFKAKSITNLKAHMMIHNPVKDMHCEICPYTCHTKDQLKKHMIRHSSEKNFQCSLCKFSCKTAMSLKRHMLIHDAPGKYVCNICNFITHDKLLLKDHKRTQHKLKPRHFCRECALEFERPLELRKHALSVHKSDQTQFCSYCEFSCHTPSELRTHMEEHFGKNSFMCSICGYSSRIKASYRRHMERHNKVKNFKCQYCSYACVEKYDLQKHIAHRHSEEKPYSCPYCPYTCKFKPRLNNHISFIHSDEKPFFCKFCPYAGKSAESLKKHMIHHGVMPMSTKAIQCVLCDYTTMERAKLRRHMQVHVNKAFIEIQTVE